MYRDGMTQPMPFFARASMAFTEALIEKGALPEKALVNARTVFDGTRNFSGEGSDPYYQLCFDGQMPGDDRFQEKSRRVFEPMLNSRKKVRL